MDFLQLCHWSITLYFKKWIIDTILCLKLFYEIELGHQSKRYFTQFRCFRVNQICIELLLIFMYSFVHQTEGLLCCPVHSSLQVTMIYGVCSTSLREFMFWLSKQINNSIGMSIITETWIGSESNGEFLP